MSHSAIVAFEMNDGYDIHHSDNGAQDLQLEPVLEEQLGSGSPKKGLGTIEEVGQLEKLGVDNLDREIDVEKRPSNKAIEPEPLARDVPLRAVGLAVDFANIEAVYIVRDGRVETYFPVWLYPNVIQPWRDNLQVEVYKSEMLERSHLDFYEKMDREDPMRVIDGDVLSGSEFLDDSIVERIVREQHANIYALCDKIRYECECNDVDFDEVGNMILQSGRYTLNIEFTGGGDFDFIPLLEGEGILVEIGRYSQRQIELAGARIRFEVGSSLNALRGALSEGEIVEAGGEAILLAYNEFGDDVARFSPPPYGQIFKALGQVDEFSPEVKSKISQYLCS